MPITVPAASTSGPPELPGAIGASVCSSPCSRSRFALVWSVAVMARPVAEIMPWLTGGLPPRPSALPMASTWSPAATREELPNRTAGRPDSPLTRSTAMSAPGSVPITAAG
jgi:hypothetical protein